MNLRTMIFRNRRGFEFERSEIIRHRIAPVRAFVPAFFTAMCLLAATAHAQTDRVYTNDGKSETGTVSAIAKAGLQLKKGSNARTIAAADILKVLWEGDPGELTSAREFALSGQYESAITELKKVDTGKLKRDGQKADFAFLKAMSNARLALGGRGSRESAASEVNAFLRAHSDSFHFYNATELLGDLALALKKPSEAMTFYGYLGRSPSVDTKIRALYLVGNAKLQAGKFDEAIADFDKVIGAPASSTAALETQTMAKAAKAAALAKKGNPAEGLALTDSLIKELTSGDVVTAAAIYNAQGDNFEASGDAEAAIQAYLHTHLMYAADPQLHAAALTKLVPLWEKVGQPDRAGEMRRLLKELYPGF